MLEGIFVPLRLDKLIECQIIRASTVTGQIFTASLPRRLFASRLLKHKMYRIWQDDYCIDALIQFNFLTRDNKIIDGTVSPPKVFGYRAFIDTAKVQLSSNVLFWLSD